MDAVFLTLRKHVMQYSAVFHGSINDYFQMKIVEIFHIFAQNNDCGYMLEPQYPQSMF